MEADAHVAPSLPRVTSDSGREDTRTDRPGPPVLDPRPGGPAEWFADRFGPENPVRVFVVALLASWALLVTAMVLFGLVLIHVVLPIGGLDEADADLSRWLADNRTPTQEDVSWVGSTLAGGHVIPAVIGLSLASFLITRRWLLAAFVLFAVVLESATYRATSMIIDRNRPEVERLEQLPVHDSYPSGHTAASIALYGGLLLLLASRIQRTALRVVTVLVGIAIPLFVSWSRMYRGMHYVTDAGAGVLMGLGALALIVFVARASRAAAERRDAGEVR
ncbi:MAG: phosphatase PAP2 family protein [Gaiellaceae bacterium]